MAHVRDFHVWRIRDQLGNSLFSAITCVVANQQNNELLSSNKQKFTCIKLYVLNYVERSTTPSIGHNVNFVDSRALPLNVSLYNHNFTTQFSKFTLNELIESGFKCNLY